MFYTVYKITNLINDKIYIGAHKTSDLDDGYMGSGVHLKRAQEKYGIENFEKEILKVFDSSEEMYSMESQLVTEDFVKDDTNYNLKEGGHGGFDHIKQTHYDKRSRNKAWIEKLIVSQKRGRDTMKWLHENDPEWLYKKTTAFINSIKEYYEKGGKNGFSGKNHSETFKEKMKGHTRQNGEKNSQFGSMWIYNLEEKVSKKIKKEELQDYENLGWIKGRKMKFI